MALTRLLAFLFVLFLAGVSLFVAYKVRLLYLYFRHRRNPARPEGAFQNLPLVTLQLPIFNEINVVERLVASAAAVDYPRDRLEIQILDDSTDKTLALTLSLAEEYRALGFRVAHIHRTLRTDFKAGALANGLKSAAGEFVAIFDSDFVIPADYLRRTIHYFTAPQVGLVQCRWGFLNGDESLLTRLQAAYLNGHFVVEHTARHGAGYFFNFNGTAGIWRKSAILASGGWQGDTLTEDLDLSYRSQINRWKFVYLNDCVVPSELPPTLHAFNGQQFRWVKGMCQVLLKLVPRIWRGPIPWRKKLDVTCHLASGVAYPLSVLISILAVPLLYAAKGPGARALFFGGLALLAVNSLIIYAYYVTAQRAVYGWRWKTVADPLLLLLYSMGLAVNGSYAVVQALLKRKSAFIRTPKFNRSFRSAVRVEGPLTPPHLLSSFFVVYFSGLLAALLWNGRYTLLPLFLFFSTGHYWVFFALTREKRAGA